MLYRAPGTHSPIQLLTKLFCALWLLIPAALSAHAVTNFWTKTTSGNWEEPVWSLGSDRAEAAAASAHEPVGEMYYRREETLESRAPDTEKKPERRVGKTVPVETISAEQKRPREEPAKSDETPQPHRRGWWQRQFRRE